MEVVALPKGFFSFNFSCEEDIVAVRCGGPWVIGKSSLALKKWTPNGIESGSCFEVVPVWLRPPRLPLEYWNEEVFRGIASSFKELLSIDQMTTARKRLVFARICVSIVQSSDLPSSIEIMSKLGNWVQKIEFETLPFVCFNYKKPRHWAKNYPNMAMKSKNNTKKVWKEKKEPTGKNILKENQPREILEEFLFDIQEGEFHCKELDCEAQQGVTESRNSQEARENDDSRVVVESEDVRSYLVGKKTNMEMDLLEGIFDSPSLSSKEAINSQMENSPLQSNDSVSHVKATTPDDGLKSQVSVSQPIQENKN